MQIFPFFLAAALMEPALPIYQMSDAQGGIEDSWSRVAHHRDQACAIDVTGNGQFFRITVSGFAPGEIGTFHLTNEDIRPVRYRFRTDESGQFSKIYVPVLWRHQGGTVSVNAWGEDCDLRLSFPWKRAEVRIH